MWRVWWVDESTHLTCESDLTLRTIKRTIWVWVLTHFVVHDLSSDLTHFLSEFAQHCCWPLEYRRRHVSPEKKVRLGRPPECQKWGADPIESLVADCSMHATGANEHRVLSNTSNSNVDGWAVTFGTASMGLGGAAARPGLSSLYQM